MKSIKSALAIALILLSPAIMADQKHGKSDHGKFSQGRHFKQFDFARVVDVEPVYREIRVSNPVKECWDEPVHQSRQHKSSGGMLAGGILGGIIGHQIGGGRGKKLATAVGTIVGAQIGHEAVNAGVGSSQDQYSRYEERCEVRHQISYEEVVDGYKVTYQYRGERYRINMPYDPGKRIKLRIQISPVI